LRALWARPWCDDQIMDRRAFAAACQEVAPQVIVEAARAWVEATDAPRFLPSSPIGSALAMGARPPKRAGNSDTRSARAKAGPA